MEREWSLFRERAANSFGYQISAVFRPLGQQAALSAIPFSIDDACVRLGDGITIRADLIFIDAMRCVICVNWTTSKIRDNAFNCRPSFQLCS